MDCTTSLLTMNETLRNVTVCLPIEMGQMEETANVLAFAFYFVGFSLFGSFLILMQSCLSFCIFRGHCKCCLLIKPQALARQSAPMKLDSDLPLNTKRRVKRFKMKEIHDELA